MKHTVLGPDWDVSLSAAALDRLMPMHLVLDGKGTIASCGPTLMRMFDDSRIVGQKFFDVFSVRRPAGVTSLRTLTLLRGERVQLDVRIKDQTFSLRGLCQDQSAGSGYFFNLSFGYAIVEAVRRLHLTESDFAPTDLAIEMLYMVEAKTAVMRELRDLNLRLQGAKQEAEMQALTDTLTGLRNRRALESEIARLISLERPFGLMHLDLDFFKQVNDTFGHAAGDHVLRHSAEVLSRESRALDTVARVGGDEFVLVFRSLDDEDKLMSIAARIIAALQVPIPFEDQLCRISGSIGITMSTQFAIPDLERMQAGADTALYVSKRGGRGRATVYRADLPALSKG